MRRRPRVTGPVAAVAAALCLLVPSPARADVDAAAVLEGTLLEVPAEADAPTGYAVRTEAGALVPVSGLPADAVPGSRLVGRVPPGSLTATGRPRGDRPVALTSSRLEPPAPTAAGPATHRWFVAVPDNFTDPQLSDAQLLAKVQWVADYWTTQSGGAIASVTVPTAVAHYTADATSEAAGCGLSGSDFSATVSEAAAEFPQASFGGGDQLILVVPRECQAGGVVGRGTLGSVSFARGGYTISIGNPAYFEEVLAHELGHNYGFHHAALGPCTTSCASEYGDYYSVMGAAIVGHPLPPALGTESRRIQGILDPGEVETLTGGVSTTTVTRTLLPRGSGSGLRSLAITEPATGKQLHLDYRSGTGPDAGRFYAAGSGATSYRPGVVVETANGASGIALVPDGTGRKALVAGDTLSIGGTTVSVTSMSSSGATVSVTIPGGVPTYPTVGAVSLSGSPRVGVPVSASLTGWSPAPTDVSYEWLADGVPLPGASGPSYAPAGGLAGHQLSVRVTVTAAGYQAATATSPAQAVGVGSIALSGEPTLAGTPRVGAPLTCTPPVVQQPAVGAESTYAWIIGGSALAGAGEPSLVPTPDQLGASVSCRVTVSAVGYATAVVESEASLVAKGVLTTAKPSLQGRARVGATLIATTGSWTEGTSFRYRWFVAGERVSDAHGPRLTLTRGMVGSKVKVVVVGRLEGYQTAERQSSGLGPVASRGA